MDKVMEGSAEEQQDRKTLPIRRKEGLGNRLHTNLPTRCEWRIRTLMREGCCGDA